MVVDSREAFGKESFVKRYDLSTPILTELSREQQITKSEANTPANLLSIGDALLKLTKK